MMSAPPPPPPPLPSRLTIGPEAQHSLSPVLYSLFYETEINFGGEGGLYAELVPNRDFESLGRGRLPSGPSDGVAEGELVEDGIEKTHDGPANSTLDPHEPAPNPNDFRPWTSINGANLSTDNSTAPFASNPNSLKVVVTVDGGGGCANPGYWGVAVRPGIEFHLTLYAKAAAEGAPLKLTAALASSSNGDEVLAEAVVKEVVRPKAPVPQTGWRKFTAILRPSAKATAQLQLHFSDAPPGSTYWLDGVSLFPSDAVGGLFRRDVFDAMHQMRPGFVRAPGGNYLEGTGPRTRWDWKASLGAAPTRPGHYNSAWGYWVTDGLGVYELLTLCELLNSTCQMSVYTGYSMLRKYVPPAQSERFAQDAIDLMQFANDPIGASKYAEIRGQMGHPAPFGLTRLEVGNEEHDMTPSGYAAHYRLITSKLWARYPSLKIVASGRWGPPIAGSPCLSGQRCDVWDDHYYRTPDVMASMGGTYDGYNRSLPKVFVGEFAANIGRKRSLRAALAEGIFMIGFERNADVVVASSFAPLCNNLRGTQWSYNLINFNASSMFVLPSYHAQRLFAHSLGDHTLITTLTPPYSGDEALALKADGADADEAPSPLWLATASMGSGAEDTSLVLKLVNYGPSARPVEVAWGGDRPIVHARASVLTADSPDAQNTLEEPLAVVPAELPLPSILSGGKGLHIEMPPWSLVVATATLGPLASS